MERNSIELALVCINGRLEEADHLAKRIKQLLVFAKKMSRFMLKLSAAGSGQFNKDQTELQMEN